MSTTFTRRDLAQFGLAIGAGALAGPGTLAQVPTFFRIGTGGSRRDLLSGRRPHRQCDLQTTTARADGAGPRTARSPISTPITSGALESGFTQSDVAYWAYTGTGSSKARPRSKICASSPTLYPEIIHLVATKSADIKSVADLKGKRVSLDEPGSGTLVDADHLGRLEPQGEGCQGRLPEATGPRAMRDGALDASSSSAAIRPGRHHRACGDQRRHRPRADHRPEAEAIREHYTFFAKPTVPAGTYKDVRGDRPRGQRAMGDLRQGPGCFVYNIVKALWSDKSRAALDAGHAKGQVHPQGHRHWPAPRIPCMRAPSFLLYREAGLYAKAEHLHPKPSPAHLRSPPADGREGFRAQSPPYEVRCSPWLRSAPSVPRTAASKEKFDPEIRFRPLAPAGRWSAPASRCPCSTTTRRASACCRDGPIAASTWPSCSA